MSQKTYLGDGLFAEIKNGELILTAENGIRATDRIVLGAHEWLVLVAFVNRTVEIRRELMQELNR
jgi:hypothetical protein